ncbi:Fe2+-dependent dioxygenase [Flavobacterium sp. MK4S-17]|uniref:Fe2+-dependent dioxygenase n=1 Tax=Flavobacterium sp. MK4S-17 TaxID=2543737 RepID=UPI00135C73D3|nr:Fe2+-dependent dioxygenase [Flavobacterium sp. MK4S-17]
MNDSNTYFRIKQLLNDNQLQDIVDLISEAPYDDGKNTASNAAREVKHNQQMNMQSSQYMGVQQILLTAINQNELFRNATFPKNIYPFLISRYTTGEGYGWHVDSPLMGNMMRTDIAMTIFLNDPSEYEGGELELSAPAGNILYKLDKGDAICYPCAQLHRVRELIRGERHVAVTWIQSLVKGTEERAILNSLREVINSLGNSGNNKPELNILQQNYSNLLRKWSE